MTDTATSRHDTHDDCCRRYEPRSVAVGVTGWTKSGGRRSVVRRVASEFATTLTLIFATALGFGSLAAWGVWSLLVWLYG